MTKDRFESLNKLIYSYKDAFAAQNEFSIGSTVKNMVLKVYSEKIGYAPLVFLVAPSFFDKNKAESIVAAGLTYLGKKVQPSCEIDLAFSERLQEFLCSGVAIKLELIEDTISATSKYDKIELLRTSSDESAKQMLLRSLCIFFASCEKEVTNNLDSVAINEYGRVS